MSLDTKQKVFMLLYKEYQKDKPQMHTLLSNIPKIAESLGISEKAFDLAIDKLQNEGYITGAKIYTSVMSFTYNGDKIPPSKHVSSDSDIKITRDGLKYAEELEKDNSEKIRDNAESDIIKIDISKLQSNIKEKVLLLIYIEYQKDITDMLNFIQNITETIKFLGIDYDEFVVVVDKLQNEGYINGVKFWGGIPIYSLDNKMALTQKHIEPLSDIKVTRDGIKYIEELMGIRETSTNKEKGNTIILRVKEFGMDFLSRVAAQLLKP